MLREAAGNGVAERGEEVSNLDEAVEAACYAYHVSFMGEPPLSRRAAKINAIPMKAAIQAAVKVLEGSIINMPDGAEIAICQIHTLSRPEIE